MNISFIANKFSTQLNQNNVEYTLKTPTDSYLLNEWIGKKIEVRHTGKFICLDCQKSVKKFYSQGLCYICTMSSPMNSECIIRPELCQAHLGIGRDIEWEKTHHNQPHIVYLANSGGLKVGVTRADQIPTRWIDQGADETIILAKTPYRQLAGMIEVFLKDYLSDKTNWRTMLKNQKVEGINLLEEKYHYANLLKSSFESYICEDDTIYTLHYPTTLLTQSIQSIKLEKVEQLRGTLTGIKGQYLIFDAKNVLNIRSHAGYEVEMTY